VKAPVSPLSTARLAVRPLGMDQVTVTGGFWADWQRRNREVTVPHALGWLERDGSVENLRRLDDGDTGAPHRGLWFSDSDVYKVLEAISWDQGRGSSDGLPAGVGDLIEVVRRAQEPGGYVNSFVQAGFDVRWDNLVKSHELYCMGHLIQAGVAYRRGTGRDELFDIARSAADCVVREFSGGRRKDTDGHPEIEMALVELYRQTGEAAYLQVAQQLVDVRGYGVLKASGHFGPVYYQDATPVREQTTVVGHAVRALYLLSGIVDIYLETGEHALLATALRQVESLTATKTYLNGAVGSRFDGEAFGEEYELPQDLVYGETCATIANIMLAWRLLLATGDGRHADTIERALYNLFSASTSVERTAFFYNNPAHRRSAHAPAPTQGRPQRAEAPGTRPAWFDCACCPPNIMRTVAALGAYVATHTDDGVQVHQYLPAAVDTAVASFAMETRYPLDGAVSVTVTETREETWTLSLRVPAWCRGAAVSVNGETVDVAANARGYLEITRDWRAGDVVELSLPMPMRFTVPHPSVDATRGCVAIERGPVVYCLEGVDQPEDVDLGRVELVVDAPIEESPRDVCGQVVPVATVEAVARDDAGWSRTGWAPLAQQPDTGSRRVRLTAIPYHLWANRGPSTMRIFVPVWGTQPGAGDEPPR